MSLMSGEARAQDVSDGSKGPVKCRIPQRLPAQRQRPLQNKAKPVSEVLRPKSANRTKDDNFGRGNHQVSRTARPDRERVQLKRPSTLPRKSQADNNSQGQKGGRNVITVPMGAHRHKYNMHSAGLPDQETIRRCEELELVRSGLLDAPQPKEHDGDSALLKSNWQQYTAQFEKMRNELGERQKAIVELYASMQNTHNKMTAMGHQFVLPPPEDLKIMNVAKLSPDQLLQLCSLRQAETKQTKGQTSANSSLTVDVKKLYGLPTRIIATCEQTLLKRKEIIDWFIDLKSEQKGISMQSLERKINEFIAENEMLKSSLDQAKADFLKEINEIVELMRITVNQTVALQLRSEDQMYELSELRAQNKDLRKQLHNTESLKSNKGKVEELEKELKDERSKKNMMKDRLSRADGQIKIGAERASQLEAALEQARSQVWTLERTVQQLNKQNQKLQSDFEKELAKLTESIRENTVHLEEIADAREKLKAEKEDLEKRLEQLSQSYNESLDAVKHDMNVNLAKLIETEKKYQLEAEEKKELLEELVTLRAISQEYETHNKELTEHVQDIEAQLRRAMNLEKDLQSTKENLEIANSDIEEYKIRLNKQADTIILLERDLKDSLCLQENLNMSLRNKDEYIMELEKKHSLQEKLLEESESKMSSYEQQLSALKRHITQLQDDFGDFENLEELHEMVNQQRANLLEATRQNGELAQALQNKDLEIQQHLENLTDQEQLLEQRDGVIKMLSEKEEEQTNIIKLLRTNLEMRTQADMDLSQQISEKNSEIEALIANVETRKQQICQLEKIILTLEEQTRKSSLQRRKDQDKINLLENQLSEYEAFHSTKPVDMPATNLDSIIRILEDELGASFEPQSMPMSPEYIMPRKKAMGDRRRETQHFPCHTGNNNIQRMYQNENEPVPTKIVMGNFVKKTYISNNEEHFKGDNLDRKKAITNIGDNNDRKKVQPDPGLNVYTVPLPDKDNNYSQDYVESRPTNVNFKDKLFLSRNIPLLNTDQFKDEKKCKMFKFAGHRL